MANDVNMIRNPEFSLGKDSPRHWTWCAKSRQSTWQRGVAGESTGRTGVTFSSKSAKGFAGFMQTIACKPDEHYRIEAIVTCDLIAADETRGLILQVQPMVDDKPFEQPAQTVGLHRASTPTVVRAFIVTADEVRRLNFSIGIVGATGTVEVHAVRVFKMIEPEEEGHPLALPDPAHTLALPKRVKKIGVCADDSDHRPITDLLRGCLDSRRIKTAPLSSFGEFIKTVDAVLLPEPKPPASLRSVAALTKLAESKIVIISLPAFVTLSKKALRLRKVVQPDDPTCAQVVFANYATAGFSLQDTFSFAAEDMAKGTYSQNQFRTGKDFTSFCKRHGLETLLNSMCDKDSTSDQPIALFKQTKGGALFVMDIDPAENSGSTRDEPVLTAHVLLSMLGQVTPGLGQFAPPLSDEPELRTHLREMSLRFALIVLDEEDVPVEDLPRQMVTIGREDESFGLPLKPKPVIMVRSGLTAGDSGSVHGAMGWFRQLVRMPPFASPYAEMLASRFRLSWIPCAARWEWREGLQRSGQPPAEEMVIDTEAGGMDALIDIESCPNNRARVVFANDGEEFERYAYWIPRLLTAFPPGRYFSNIGPTDGCPSDLTRRQWSPLSYPVTVEVDTKAFDSQAHRNVLDTGGQVIRVEIPGFDANTTAHSIFRTDLAATLLEHVIGLRFGLLAVNRQRTKAQLERFAPVGSGDALVVERGDPLIRPTAAQVG